MLKFKLSGSDFLRLENKPSLEASKVLQILPFLKDSTTVLFLNDDYLSP